MINAETKVGNLLVIYTPGIEMMGIVRVGELLGVRESVEEVERLEGESAEDWHKRAIERAKELQ